MSFIVRGDYKSALNLVKPYWSPTRTSLEQIFKDMKGQMTLLTSQSGKPISYEFIRENQAGKSLRQLVFIEKFNDRIIRWVSIFYKPHDTWKLNSLSYDEYIERLFWK